MTSCACLSQAARMFGRHHALGCDDRAFASNNRSFANNVRRPGSLCALVLTSLKLCHRWGHLKTPTRPDNSPCKYFAFLNVCHFLEAFSAPEKITLQVTLQLHCCMPG